MMKRTYLLSTILAAAAMAVPATAQQSDSKSDRENRQQNQQDVSKDQTRGMAVVSGKVKDVKSFAIGETGEKHVLVKLQAESGDNVVIDMGTERDLMGVQLRQDQQMKILARPGRVNDKPILVADRVQGLSKEGRPELTIIRVAPMQDRQDRQSRQASGRQQDRQQYGQSNQQNRQQYGQQGRQDRQSQQASGQQGQSFRIGQDDQQARDQRQQQNRQQSAQRSQQGRVQQFDQMSQQQGQQQPTTIIAAGTLENTQNIRLKGQQQQHVLATMRSASGERFYVDLGPESNVQKLPFELEQGETLAAIGVVGMIDGRPVLMARQIADVESLDRSIDQRAVQASGQLGPAGQQPQQGQRQQGQRQQSSGQDRQSGQQSGGQQSDGQGQQGQQNQQGQQYRTR
ncbi:MAG: hypothetical protein ACFCVE_05170 [Phycisphaerae bacterium]